MAVLCCYDQVEDRFHDYGAILVIKFSQPIRSTVVRSHQLVDG